MSEVIYQINGKDIGGDAGDGSGMTINEIVKTIYNLSENLQCPIYYGKTQPTGKIPKGALWVKIED